MDNTLSGLSNAFSTGGGGFNFETHVQAAYVVLMMTGGFAPCLRSWPITKIKLQGRYAGYHTDDFIAFTTEPNGGREAKILAQIKHVATITESDSSFEKVIRAAWSDFNNSKLFDKDKDVFALITGPLSDVDTENTRTILDWAHSAATASEFIGKIALAKFSSEDKRKKLNAFRVQLGKAKGSPVTDNELWLFMKSFHLLGYDLDVENGVVVSLLRSIIGRNVPEILGGIWEKIVNHVQYANQKSGTITKGTVSDEIREAFEERQPKTIPAELVLNKPAMLAPQFYISESPSDLMMALMFGEWSDSSKADGRAIEEFFNTPYTEWIEKIREIFHQPDTPLSFHNGHWKVNDCLELWKQLGSRIYDGHLDKFKNVAVTVLKEQNPELDLDPEKRHAAQVYGKVLEHSRHFRKGIASTLAIFGNNEEIYINCSLGKIDTVVILTVRELLQEHDWRLWASLDDVLPLLAEAAPNEFLDAVEKVLLNTPQLFIELFSQESSDVFGSNYLTGLLWALQTLAWEEKYLVRVVAILGELASIVSETNMNNRPSNSLVTILLPWLPQTLAPVSTREAAMSRLIHDFPDVAWTVLLLLLPRGKDSSSGSHRPTWRPTIPQDYKEGVTHDEYWEQIDTYSAMAIEFAKQSYTKLSELIERTDDLPPNPRKSLLEYLESQEVLNLDESDREVFWDKLDRIVSRHRRYSDEPWALSSQELDRIEKVAETIAPVSPAVRFQRLFCDGDYDLLEGEGDYHQRLNRLEAKRLAAIKQILEKGGYNSVHEFVKQVHSPQMVGFVLGKLDDESGESKILPILLLNEEKAFANFAAGFVRGRFSQRGWSWVHNLKIESWNGEQIGQFLAHLPFVPETWNYVSQIMEDEEAPYWTKTQANPFETEADLTPAVNRLVAFDRPNAAIRCIDGMLNKNQAINVEATISALEAVSDSSSDPNLIDPYTIRHIVKFLQEQRDISKDKLANIEWKFLLLFEYQDDARPLTLEHKLAEDASFFIDIIRVVYRAENEVPNEQEPSEEKRQRASMAFSLLIHWKYPPGLQEDGSFNGEYFRAWLSKVKTECKASGHLKAALVKIGHVLRYCPKDPDGLWLPHSVAEALNERDAGPMRTGLHTEFFNSRGVCKFTGGKEEMELAEKFEKYAQEVERYHRLASELRNLAETYRHEAKRTVEVFCELSGS